MVDNVDRIGHFESASVFSLDGHQLKYRGEGNGSVVVAIGDTGKILRLIKVENGGGVDLIAAPSTSSAVVKQPRLNDDLHWLVRFMSNTVSPLVGRRFIHPGEIVGVGADDLRRLNRELESVRPDYRKKKNVAEVDSYALLMPDLCSSWTLKQRVPNVNLHGPILTVEIKPKMGFTMESVGSTAEARTKFCKYSLMQQWKLKNNKISDVSSYCPLDLFSGCPLRLQRALRDLLNNPQNNLRLFLDGKLIYGDGIGSCVNDALQPFFPCESSSSVSDRICSLISEALMRDHPLDDADIEIIRNNGQQTRTCGCKQFQRSQDMDTNHCCDDCRLPLGSILSRILHMQMLSDMDAISLLPMYNQWRKELNEYPIEKLHQLLYSDIISLTECKLDEGTPEWVLQKIKLYLLSCTAKDCSIMMTFSNYSEETVTKEFNPWIIREATCVHSIAMVDVDWKSHDRIPQHAELEENLAK